MQGKDKLNTIEVLISKAFIDSHVSHEEFISMNNVLREYVLFVARTNQLLLKIKNFQVISFK